MKIKRLMMMSWALTVGALACQGVSPGETAQSAGVGGKADSPALDPTGRPWFSVDGWKQQQTGPVSEPFFLQVQLVHFRLEAPSELTDLEKKPVQVTMYGAMGEKIYDFTAMMKIRGSSSRKFPKKQYAMTIVDASGKDQKLALWGMAESEDYVLSAPYNDRSLLRDILTYNLFNQLGRYAPRNRIATMNLKVGDGPEEAMGLYVLTEKNALGKGKVDILKEKDGATAFLLNIDRVKEGDKAVKTKKGLDVLIDFPKASKLTAAQEASLKAFLDDVEARLGDRLSAGFQKLFAERIDLDSAVSVFVMQELARNVNGYRLSSPMYIPPNGKLTFGPIWDFNLGYGNADYGNGWRADGWRAQESGVWFADLMKHPLFCARLKTQWASLRDSVLSNNNIFATLDAHASVMAPALEENFARWGIGYKVWPNAYWLGTHADELSALKSWIAQRTAWMDRSIQEMTCQPGADR